MEDVNILLLDFTILSAHRHEIRMSNVKPTYLERGI